MVLNFFTRLLSCNSILILTLPFFNDKNTTPPFKLRGPSFFMCYTCVKEKGVLYFVSHPKSLNLNPSTQGYIFSSRQGLENDLIF